MTAWLVAAFHVGLAGILLRRLGPLHPATLWAAPFAITTTLFALALLPYRDMAPAAAVLLAAATTAFCATAVAGGRRRRSEPSRAQGASAGRLAPRAAGAGLLVLAAWLAAFLVEVAAAHGWRATVISSAEVRQDLQAGAAGLTIKYVYATTAAAALCALAAARAELRRDRRAWLAGAAVAAGSAYFSTGRSNMVLPLAAAAIVYATARGLRPGLLATLRAGAIAAVVVFAVFTAGGQIIGKTYDNAPVSRVDSAFAGRPLLQPFALPYQYATAPIGALGVQVSVAGEIPRTDGCATFSVACQLASAAGIAAEPVPRIRPFTAEPLPWNTYTALDLPLLDAGPAGVIAFFLVAGFLAGAVHARALQGRALWLVTYGIVASAIVVAPVQNNFLAPHVIGALVIGAGLLAAAAVAPRARRYGVRLPGPSSLRSR